MANLIQSFKRLFAPGGRISIKVLRPVFIYGQRVEAGAVIEVDAVVGSEAVATRRAAYLTDSDAEAARAGVRAELVRLAKNENFIRPSFWSRKGGSR